jgi:hypothetical protein
LDPDKRRALSDFYREEFLRHLEHLECNGVLNDTNRAVVHRACRRFMSDLDRICWRSDFSVMAETLLRSFDALTCLSKLSPRQHH